MDEVLHVGCLGCAVGLLGKNSKIKREKDAHVNILACVSGLHCSCLICPCVGQAGSQQKLWKGR